MNDYGTSPDVSGYGNAATSAPNPLVGWIILLIILVIYCYTAYAVMVIAKKTNTKNAWMAWVPIANVFLMIQVAKKPLWWFILLLIPLVNIVFAIIIWMKIAEAVGKPSWWGILMIIPIVNLFILGYLAFSSSIPTPMPPTMPTPPATPSTTVA